MYIVFFKFSNILKKLQFSYIFRVKKKFSSSKISKCVRKLWTIFTDLYLFISKSILFLKKVFLTLGKSDPVNYFQAHLYRVLICLNFGGFTIRTQPLEHR